MRRGEAGRINGGSFGGGSSGLFPSSLRILSSCLKTVSSNASSVANAVRSAGTSVAASISGPVATEAKDQVLWAGFDKLELDPSTAKHVLLVGYVNGFQMVDIEDASHARELVSKRDGPVTFLRLQPIPASSNGPEGFRALHPMLLVVAVGETNGSGTVPGTATRDTNEEHLTGYCNLTPTAVRFYSLTSHSYVHILRFRSTVYTVRCSHRIVAVALATQIYCFDAVTLESKFTVLTSLIQGTPGINIGYGPMDLGPRWLAYASVSPLPSNTGRLSPQSLIPSPGFSPSTSPGSGNLVARCAIESSKQLAAGIITLGDMGYRTLSKYSQELVSDGSGSPVSTSSGRSAWKLPSNVQPAEADISGMVVVKDVISMDIIAQFRAHTSPLSALCFDPSGTLLVTASVHGHNVNIFRIMPAVVARASGSVHYDWTASHVHLYKLFRGLTAAVIQDISFSSCSHFVSIVSSRGTCHIFTLFPFGGDDSFQPQNFHNGSPSHSPNLSRPCCSNSSHLVDQSCHPPVLPITLSAAGRIKSGVADWLNSISNVTASASGKLSVPSGALAVVFHNSLSQDSSANSAHHLLAYSPSGHIVQYELLPSARSVSSDSGLTSRSSPLLQLPDDELHINAKPFEWWDICRRTSWPEREERVFGATAMSNRESSLVTMNSSVRENSRPVDFSTCVSSVSGEDPSQNNERSNWYLSNAEVQTCSGRIPLWQKPEVSFYTMSMPPDTDMTDLMVGSEIEIEKLPIQRVETGTRSLRPILGTERAPVEVMPWEIGSESNQSQSHLINAGGIPHSEAAGDVLEEPRNELAEHLHEDYCQVSGASSGCKSTDVHTDDGNSRV